MQTNLSFRSLVLGIFILVESSVFVCACHATCHGKGGSNYNKAYVIEAIHFVCQRLSGTLNANSMRT